MKQLEIEGSGGWIYTFRKKTGRPIEFKQSHIDLGDHGGWKVARNYCLKSLIRVDELCDFFGICEYEYRFCSTPLHHLTTGE